MLRRKGEGGNRQVFTPGNAKRAIAVGKVLAPALLPVAFRAAGLARGLWDERRARRLGVAPGDLNRFSGKGAGLHARIAALAGSLIELRATGRANEFVRTTEARLIDLSAAVRAAEFMPTERRRAAHRAVAGELDRIEPALLDLLGVNSPPVN
ncbi:DUF6474 family protein [Pseudonocardia eucalypti]|uniref:DUF6474 family protein n=1 Tax=Pseudonocardia eucalypti TaxID=648755 RepID=A0ABP9PIP0_9PSEU|nr:hypothetical protein [Pseudonocardia eucalypti]